MAEALDRCPRCGSRRIKWATLIRGGWWLGGIYSPSRFFVCGKCGFAFGLRPHRAWAIVSWLVIIAFIVILLILLLML